MIEHINITKITYEKPLARDAEKCDWCFRAELSANAAHGHPVFGGTVKQIGDGVWKAKGNCVDFWSRPANSRGKAIQNSLADGLAGLQDFANQMAENERKREERSQAANALRVVFEAWSNISVNDEHAWDVDKSSSYIVKIAGLQPVQVQLLAALLETSGVDIKSHL